MTIVRSPYCREVCSSVLARSIPPAGGDDEPDAVSEIGSEKMPAADIAVGFVVGTIPPSGYRRPFSEIAG